MAKLKCGRCGSTDLRKHGIKLLSGRKAQQWQCKQCGYIFHE